MDMELTARQGKITKALQAQAADGMDRIARILGKTVRVSIKMSTQRHLQIAELTVHVRLQTFAATGKAATTDGALREAFDHAENQARRYRDRRMENKRLPKEEKTMTSSTPDDSGRRRASHCSLSDEGVEGQTTRAKARTSIAVPLRFLTSRRQSSSRIF